MSDNQKEITDKLIIMGNNLNLWRIIKGLPVLAYKDEEDVKDTSNANKVCENTDTNPIQVDEKVQTAVNELSELLIEIFSHV